MVTYIKMYKLKNPYKAVSLSMSSVLFFVSTLYQVTLNNV